MRLDSFGISHLGVGTMAAIISRWALVLVSVAGGMMSMEAVLYAQGAKENGKILRPKDIDLETRDGLVVAGTYYPSKLGKEAVAVLMLHDFEGSRVDLAPLALVLQRAGHAVLTIDFRGHGQSTSFKGSTRPLQLSQLRPNDFLRMATEDVECAKRFLLEENNQGHLNIEKLCVLGVGMGGTVALEWALLDWSWPQLPTYKQGRDVKALVLISPEFVFRSLSAARFFKHPEAPRRISALILCGEEKLKAFQDAKRIHGMFERFRPKTIEKPELRDLFFIPLKTNLQGARLIDAKNLAVFKIDQVVLNFLRLRLVEQSYPWRDRRSPLEQSQ